MDNTTNLEILNNLTSTSPSKRIDQLDLSESIILTNTCMNYNSLMLKTD